VKYGGRAKKRRQTTDRPAVRSDRDATRTMLVLLALAVIGGVAWWLDAARSHQAPSASAAATFQPTVANRRPTPGPPSPGMVWIPGGEFSMGARIT
jgi:formylglycine-generating enzyme